MGEDVGRYGGCYAVSKGLLEEFGEERIRDTPLSESAFVGAGIGAALGGMRPIVEIMTVNFSLLALDQIVNNAATIRHMSGGQFSDPAGDPHGDRRRAPARRAAFAQPRRLVRAHPRHQGRGAGDARGRARHAVDRARRIPTRCSSSSTRCSTTWKASLPPMPGAVDIDQAAVRRAGSDVTLITYGGSLGKTLAGGGAAGAATASRPR